MINRLIMILKIVREHWFCIKLQVLKPTIRAMTVKTTAEKRIHNLETGKTSESVEKTANFVKLLF